MLQYERIDISGRIDFDKTNKSKECMICHYWYFKDIGIKYQPYVCNGCHDLSMVVQNLNEAVDYRCYVPNMSKDEAIKLLKNSVLGNKGVL